MVAKPTYRYYRILAYMRMHTEQGLVQYVAAFCELLFPHYFRYQQAPKLSPYFLNHLVYQNTSFKIGEYQFQVFQELNYTRYTNHKNPMTHIYDQIILTLNLYEPSSVTMLIYFEFPKKYTFQNKKQHQTRSTTQNSIQQ